jgi:hypothetical protein
MPSVILRPDGAGDLAQWTSLATGNNWEDTNDANDITMVEADIVGQQDLHTIDPLGVSGVTINSVSLFCRHSSGTDPEDLIQLCWKVTAEARTGQINVSAGVTENSFTIDNPDGGDWTEAAIASLQIGYILNGIFAGTLALHVQDVWISVNYTVNAGRVSRPAMGLSGLGGLGQMSFDPLR